ncbi:oligosaccharide flippase family protein [Oculatella sp. LEGE 06141]|uniref:oligosaccharide flippase family protein n=1 Tax=Oculatella sp. LEGE 06141 TaxID=1828648 RepID=UPI0018817139|nr:oligosaccharide flippase family protein [Oculatella sp. LEGE 06141]MBE9178910.1 oligosaccharide flippase family protein [Oculatella sp. LEGE 06141]
MGFSNPVSWIEKKLQSKFLRNLGWLGSAEIFIRVFRLATTVVIARYLSETEYGLGAIVLTIHEFTSAFTRLGIAAQVIQADEKDLEELSNSAYYLNWIVFIGLFVLQSAASFPISWFYQDSRLILPICASALIYLMVPVSTIQAAYIHRENRLKVTALNNSIQLTASNLMSALLAFMGFGLWALVLPRVCSTPIWVYTYYTNHPWRPTRGFTTKRWGEISRFTKNYLGVQLLHTMREYLDYLIVGRFVGIRELGIYYFAFNAGLGISLSITKAITSALLPHLCEALPNRENFRKRYFSSLRTIAFIIIPFVLLQSTMAPFYVPIVFGAKWVEGIPVLILICLSAIPRPFIEAAGQLHVANGRPDIVLRWDLIFTVVFALGLLFGVQWGVLGVAIAVLLIHIIYMPIYVLWTTRFVFSNKGEETRIQDPVATTRALFNPIQIQNAGSGGYRPRWGSGGYYSPQRGFFDSVVWRAFIAMGVISAGIVTIVMMPRAIDLVLPRIGGMLPQSAVVSSPAPSSAPATPRPLASVTASPTPLALSPLPSPAPLPSYTSDPTPELTPPLTPTTVPSAAPRVCPEATLSPLSSADPDYVYPDGTQYYGPIEAGLPSTGQVTMVFPSGNRYDGDLQDGRRNGCGTLTFTNGRRYSGQFQNDLFNGWGEWRLESGNRYIGEFKDNKCDGIGTFIFSDGSSKSGNWQNGILADGNLTCDR